MSEILNWEHSAPALSTKQGKDGIDPLNYTNAAKAYLNELGSPASIKTQRSHLNWCVRLMLTEYGMDVADLGANIPDAEVFIHFPWQKLDRKMVLFMRDHRERTHIVRHGKMTAPSRATINGLLSALRGVATKAVYIYPEFTAEMLAGIKDVKAKAATRLREPVILNDNQIRRIISTINDDRSAYGVRDTAIVAAILGAGLRRSDIGAIQMDNYDPATGDFTVIGKGNKEAFVTLPEWARKYVNHWISDLRGTESGALFCRIRKDEQLERESGLTPDGVAWIIDKRVGMMDSDLSFRPHDLRHTFAERMRQRGADIYDIQQSLRHNSIETTKRYLHNTRQVVSNAIKNDKSDF